MPQKRVKRLWLLLFCGGLTLALFLVKSRPQATLAQDTPADTNAHKLFLPYSAAGAAVPSATVTAEDDGHTHPHPLHESWPPQPEGVAAVRWLANAPSAEVLAAESALSAAAQQIVQAAAVQAALGERFVQAASVYVDDKAAARAAAAQGLSAPTTMRLTYFSYSHNATVEVLVQDGAVLDVKSMPAAQYQPEPTHSEKQIAIDLARAYFIAQGFARVEQLTGYVIQAYQPEGNTGFYANRVLYVTFHARLDERPEFVAWVDLTEETVSKARQDQYQVTPKGEAQ